MAKTNSSKRLSTRTIALGAILTALVVVLQFLGQFIRFGPVAISLVLIPIVIGAATCGTRISTWLGFVFGVVVLFSDAQAFIAIDILGTIVTVLVKGVLCGLCAGLSYKFISKFNVYAAVAVAAFVCPVVNTGVFLACCSIFFMDTLTEWATSFGFSSTVDFMFLGLVGANFLFELATNIVLSPVVVRILNIRKRQK
ncbi:MAG: ECF transporter S component [Clostridia bacterium]|nr:ECF transporter S component [Clostridia bacterium]